jgi:GNAT superfamily N-acetyltransferase
VLSVRSAHPGDVRAIAELLAEMDRFYGVTTWHPARERQAQIKAMIFRDPPAAYVVLAGEHERVCGLASYSFLWPAAALTRSLFLKELYVAEMDRRRGVGRLLMQRIFELAAEAGCSRVDWMTENINTDAQRFYKRLGFTVTMEKVVYRVQSEPTRPPNGTGQF